MAHKIKTFSHNIFTKSLYNTTNDKTEQQSITKHLNLTVTKKKKIAVQIQYLAPEIGQNWCLSLVS